MEQSWDAQRNVFKVSTLGVHQRNTRFLQCGEAAGSSGCYVWAELPAVGAWQAACETAGAVSPAAT